MCLIVCFLPVDDDFLRVSMEDISGFKSLTFLDGKKRTCGSSTQSLNPQLGTMSNYSHFNSTKRIE